MVTFPKFTIASIYQYYHGKNYQHYQRERMFVQFVEQNRKNKCSHLKHRRFNIVKQRSSTVVKKKHTGACAKIVKKITKKIFIKSIDRPGAMCYNKDNKERDTQRTEKEDKTMTREELRKKLEALETREFMIHMIDRWTEADKRMLAEVEKEIREIKAQLA